MDVNGYIGVINKDRYYAGGKNTSGTYFVFQASNDLCRPFGGVGLEAPTYALLKKRKAQKS